MASSPRCSNHRTYLVGFCVLLLIGLGAALRVYRLADDLPYQRLGASGAFLLDEGAYQAEAAHKVWFGQWRVPGGVYAAWNLPSYRALVYGFFRLLDADIFAARLASVCAMMLGLTWMLFFFRRHLPAMPVLLFGLFSATNYLLVMWSKIALPYAVTILPATGILVCAVLAVWRRSSGLALAAAGWTLIAFTVKETAIFFIPITAVVLFLGMRSCHAVSVLRALRFSGWYVGGALLLVGVFYVGWVAPTAHAPWNTSAHQMQGVVSQMTQTLAQPLMSTQRQYTLAEAVTKLCLKFLGMRHIAFSWVLAVIGLWTSVRAIRRLRNAPSVAGLITLFMASWGIGMPLLLIVTLRHSLAVHWIPVYLPPILYFAALGAGQLWRATRARVLARVAAIALVCCTMASDGYLYADWLRGLPTHSRIAGVTGEMMRVIAGDGARRVVLTVDCFFPFLRAVGLKTFSLRSFQQALIPELFAAWKPGYMAVLERPSIPDASAPFLDVMHASSYALTAVGRFPLGRFDGAETTVVLHRIGYDHSVQ